MAVQKRLKHPKKKYGSYKITTAATAAANEAFARLTSLPVAAYGDDDDDSIARITTVATLQNGIMSDSQLGPIATSTPNDQVAILFDSGVKDQSSNDQVEGGNRLDSLHPADDVQTDADGTNVEGNTSCATTLYDGL